MKRRISRAMYNFLKRSRQLPNKQRGNCCTSVGSIWQFILVHLFLSVVVILLLFCGQPLLAQEVDPSIDTLLMFVGETEETVTVASRTPEEPATAPAVVTIINREKITQGGYRTLAELLADQPGFYLLTGGRGTTPYLRGQRNSVLFLYDGVPLTTDVTRNFAVLDQEISLVAVERVEIVRGAGSVLWGADAFAGVVNIVPRRGQPESGGGVTLGLGGEGNREGDFSWGSAGRNWDLFLNLNGFNGQGNEQYLAIPADEQLGTSLEDSRYGELVANLTLGDWLQVSGRWSDYEHHYQMRNAAGTILWDGVREAPVNYLKSSISTSRGGSHYSLTGFFQETDYQVEDAGIERQQTNRVGHLEFLWDRRIFSRGLLTLGTSWRENRVTGALVQDVYLPGFLVPDETFFVPNIEQESFSNRLWSAYSQLRYRTGKGEWWAGLRLDDHSQYPETLTWTLGFYRSIGTHLGLKGIYGNAFRSPYSSQLFGQQDFEPESVKTASLQLSWQGEQGNSVELTLYHSHLIDHIEESPFGLSLPANRNFYGLEGAIRIVLTPQLSLAGSLSLSHDDGSLENYQILVATFLRPDGSREEIYDSWSEPLNQGPGWLARLGLEWCPASGHSLAVASRWGGDYSFSYDKGMTEEVFSYPLLIDMNYRRPGFLRGRDQIQLRVTNLTDRNYRQPDLYGYVTGDPMQISLSWEMYF